MGGTKMKGIYKGFNKYLSQMFVIKEREIEMEIGYPTDVKHVAHIGWDGQNDNSAPTWMNEFKTSSGFSTTVTNIAGSENSSAWASQDFDQMGSRRSEVNNRSSDNLENPKKQKRKKIKSASSSPKSSSSTSRSSKAAKSKPFRQMGSTLCQD